MSNPSAKARQQQVFVVEETAKGTLAFPSSGDILQCTGQASINQQPSFTDSNVIVDSRDTMDRFADAFGPGEWSIPSAITHSGAGVAPDEGVLLKALFGTETVNASTSVVYSQADEKPSISIWRKIGHTVVFAAGVTVSKCDGALSKTGGAEYTFSGQFMKMGIVGTADCSATISAAGTTVTFATEDDAKKFSIGGRVEFVESDVVKNNSDTGYTISARDITAKTITISPGAEEEITSGATVRPYLPTGVTTGTQLPNRKGKAVVNSVDTTVRSLDFSIGDPVTYFDEEITTDGYPEDYAEGTRDINGNMSVTFRQDDAHYFYDGYEADDVDLDAVIGDTAGAIVTLAMPKANVSSPAITDADLTVKLDMTFKALGTSGNDSATLTFS